MLKMLVSSPCKMVPRSGGGALWAARPIVPVIVTSTARGSSAASSSEMASPTASGSSHEIDLPNHGAGSIWVICGPMFAGKTTELLKQARGLQGKGHRVQLVKSSKDTRYHADAIVTHKKDGVHDTMPAIAVGSLMELQGKLGEAGWRQAEVIGIDEAQFFPDLLEFAQQAEADGKHLLVSGLDGDFKRRRFGQVLDLMPMADQVIKLSGKCYLCGQKGEAQKSLFSMRVIADERQELVGGSEAYIPVCRRHFVEFQKMRSASSTPEASPLKA